jgi:N-acetylmuramoyl-L-alanine amidase
MPGHPGGLPPFGHAQIERLIASLATSQRWRIPPDGCSAIPTWRLAARRSRRALPWERLHRAGIGHWVAPAPIRDGRFFARGDEGMPVEALQAMLALYGYGVPITGVFDAGTEAVVAAFQRHFRPERVDGVADASTITTLRDLVASRRPRRRATPARERAYSAAITA